MADSYGFLDRNRKDIKILWDSPVEKPNTRDNIISGCGMYIHGDFIVYEASFYDDDEDERDRWCGRFSLSDYKKALTLLQKHGKARISERGKVDCAALELEQVLSENGRKCVRVRFEQKNWKSGLPLSMSCTRSIEDLIVEDILNGEKIEDPRGLSIRSTSSVQTDRRYRMSEQEIKRLGELIGMKVSIDGKCIAEDENGVAYNCLMAHSEGVLREINYSRETLELDSIVLEGISGMEKISFDMRETSKVWNMKKGIFHNHQLVLEVCTRDLR